MIAAGLAPLAPERKLLAASRIFLRELEARIAACENFAFETTLANDFSHRVDRCTCFMNDGENPVLIFEQCGETRDVMHADYYQLLIGEAQR